MSFQDEFKKTIQILNHEDIHYALAGGMMASFYRAEPRATADLDFLIWSTSSEKKSEELLDRLGLDIINVDFLLPSMPWVEEALQRAQFNRIDFGFGAIPCITLEDFVIAKCFSFYNQSDRFKDLDDLQSIFRKKQAMDVGLSHPGSKKVS